MSLDNRCMPHLADFKANYVLRNYCCAEYIALSAVQGVEKIAGR